MAEGAWHEGPWEEDAWYEQGQEAELRPLEGTLVEIHGCEERVVPLDGAEDEGEAVDANGRRGRACYWSEEQGVYLVRTFEGLLLGIPEGNLREYDPGAPEDGGFDVAWPEHPDAYEAFAGMVCQDLIDKGYCLIQMFQREERRKEAWGLAAARDDYTCLKQELEEGYLGSGAYCKVAWLQEDPVPASSSSSRAPDAISECHQQLEELCSMLAPAAPELLDFVPIDGCIGTLLRVPFRNTVEEVELDVGQLFEQDIAAGKVEEYIDFARRRRLCMMYLVDGEGGSVVLDPLGNQQEAAGEEEETPTVLSVKLPITRGKVLVFRHDRMRFAYSPDGADMVLQAWMAQEPNTFMLEDGLRGQVAGKELDAVFGIERGVRSPAGLQDNIASIACRLAAGGEDIEMYWTWLAAGTDTFQKIPHDRFDMDLYYTEDGTPGMTSVKHGGLRETTAWLEFDHDFFNMTAEEAQSIFPDYRVLLETAYETMWRGGYTRRSLRGAPIWFYNGDSGSDAIEQGTASAQTFGIMTSGTRLMHTLGLTGTPLCIDTACSSSLVAASLCQHGLRERRMEAAGSQQKHEPRSHLGLTMGSCALLGVQSYIVLSGGGFLSPDGRCFTFDSSANGYARGEGVTGVFLKGSDEACDAQERLACMIGSDVNQDGRSASMTAPNGPSQQLCIKASLNMAKLSSPEVAMGEMHGTGTALGDPIEVGALRNVMTSVARETPVLHSSAKAMTGHLEACAGGAGLVKCVVMALTSAGSPNCHLRLLNPHLDVNGYPTYFLTEMVDALENTATAGVSSFGYGGTNARADIWARCRRGPRKTCDLSVTADRLKLEKLDYISIPCPRCMGPMCWLCSMAFPKNAPAEKHHCFAIREDYAKYDLCSECFEGAYRHGEAAEGLADPGEGVFITGTWCAWAEYEEMTRMPSGEYVAEISLGETRTERFNLALDAEPWRTIHPMEPDAGPRSRIVGPESPQDGPRSKHWLLDGKRDGVEAGTVYRVTFRWTKKQKSISWEATDVKRPVRVENEQRGRRYSVVGSWTAWRFRNMAPDPDELDTWKMTIKIGITGEEEFHFARDQDTSQAIYPSEPKTSEPHVPVRGPDGRGSGKNWVVRGAPGEAVTLKLRVVEGAITVSTHSERGDRVWTTVSALETHVYHIAGSWTGWALSRMAAVDGSADEHRCYVTIGEEALEEFQIVVDRDWEQVFHPTSPCASPGEGIVAGPNADGEGLHWQIFGPPGQTVEITLNLRSEDRRNIVSSRRLAWNEHPPALPTEEEEWEERPYDIVIYGATGFVGQLMVQHLDALLSKGASRSSHTWAVAGRNITRLSKIARGCRSSPGILEARTANELAEMAGRCRVVVNAAGPSAKAGEPVVRACVEQGTDYVDVSCEHQWIRHVIDKYHEAAKERGVAVICSVGQASASFDIMCAKLVERLGPLARTRIYLSENRAESGGELSSKIASLEQLAERTAEFEQDPFSLGGRRRSGDRPEDSVCVEFAEQDEVFPSLFLAPTAHRSCPERVVRRSSGLAEEVPGALEYGRDFQVVMREVVSDERTAEELVQQRLPAPKSRASRDLAARRLRAEADGVQGPLPGQGPPEQLRAMLGAECYALAESESGRKGHVVHAAPAGHEVTAILCVTAALVLAEERTAVLPGSGGVVTPALAFQRTSFAERVQANAFARTDHRKLSFKYADGYPDEQEVRAAVQRTSLRADLARTALSGGVVSRIAAGPLAE